MNRQPLLTNAFHLHIIHTIRIFSLLIAFRGLANAPLVTNLNITYLKVQNENLMKSTLKGGKMGLGKRGDNI
jgi:hypothetical protein